MIFHGIVLTAPSAMLGIQIVSFLRLAFKKKQKQRARRVRLKLKMCFLLSFFFFLYASDASLFRGIGDMALLGQHVVP